MNQREAQLWVDELLSGEHEQGRDVLEDNEGRKCCLGVLCRAAMKDGVELHIERQSVSMTYDGHTTDPPERVRRWIGLKSEDPNLVGDSAMKRNDIMGQSFEEIADAVQREAGLR